MTDHATPDPRNRPVNPYAAPQNRQPGPSNPYAAPAPQPAQPAQPRPWQAQFQPQQSRPHSTASRVANTTVAALQEVHTTRPGLISTVLLRIGAVCGVIAFLGTFTEFGDSVPYALGGLCISAAVTLACAWPLSRRRIDRKALTAWEEDVRRNRELSALLTEEDAAIAAGLAPAPRPTPVPRHWKVVGTAAGLLVIVGGILVGVGQDDYDRANPPTYGSSTTR
jgi:hypothetical protein